MCLKLTFKEIDHRRNVGVQSRDLVKTHPAYLLDGQFLENLLFGQKNISKKIFQFWLFGGNNQIFF